MTQRGDRLVICADLPGVRRDDLVVEIRDGMLVMEGERRQESAQDARGVWRSERSHGRFHRSVPLPEGADADQAQATLHDGVLEVSMPAPQRARGRRLEIGGETTVPRRASGM